VDNEEYYRSQEIQEWLDAPMGRAKDPIYITNHTERVRKWKPGEIQPMNEDREDVIRKEIISLLYSYTDQKVDESYTPIDSCIEAINQHSKERVGRLREALEKVKSYKYTYSKEVGDCAHIHSICHIALAQDEEEYPNG